MSLRTLNRDVHAVLGLPALAPRSFRLLAVTLDVALVCVLSALMLMGLMTGSLGAFGALEGARHGLLQRIGSGGLGAAGIFLSLAAGAALLVLTLYQWFLLSTRGQTIGKRLFGIHIVDATTGKRVGAVQALLLRSMVPALISTVIIALLGRLFPPIGGVVAVLNLVPLFGAERRCVHDYLAGTQVRWVEAKSELRLRVVAVTGLAVIAVGVGATLLLSPAARQFAPPSVTQLLSRQDLAPTTMAPALAPTPLPAPTALAPISAPVPQPVAVPAPPSVAAPDVAPPPAAPPARHAIYSWVDGNGTTSFTDEPGKIPARFKGSIREVQGE